MRSTFDMKDEPKHDTSRQPISPGLGSAGLADALRAGLGCVPGASAAEPADSHKEILSGTSGNERVDTSEPTEFKSRVVREASVQARDVVGRLFVAAGWPEPVAKAHGEPRPSRPGLALRMADGAIVPMVQGASMTIGREAGVDTVVVDRREVSRRHVRVEVREGALSAADLGSSNGTRLHRGSEVHQLVPGLSVEVFPGDRLDVLDGIDLCVIVTTHGRPS